MKLNSSEISKKKSYFTLLQRKKKRVLIALIDRENKNTITHLQGYMAYLERFHYTLILIIIIIIFREKTFKFICSFN